MENYEVIKEIGEGSFGKVSLVKHIKSKKLMVWKQINYGQMQEKEKQQLINEVNILREINKNENIVRYYDKIVDKVKTTIYIIMEYCAGGDLSQHIKRVQQKKEQIPEQQIWTWLMQLVYALFECHRRKDKKIILHRDLKPSNIFLDDKNNVKLGDFGFAKTVNTQSEYANTYLGTLFYMSPEQINESQYNEKCDIWSLGCIIYEMATLEKPFQAENSLSLAIKIKNGQIKKRIPAQYSEELMRVIKWMLKVDPKQRANVEDLLNQPNVSMILRDKSLMTNIIHMKRREEEVKKKEQQIKEKEEELNRRERELMERERAIEENERAVQEMLRLKKYSGSSTNAATDIANDSSLQQIQTNNCGNSLICESENNETNYYFTSSHNNELIGSIGCFKTSSNDISRDDSQQIVGTSTKKKSFATKNMEYQKHSQSTSIGRALGHPNLSQQGIPLSSKQHIASSEMTSEEFKKGNMTQLLRDSSSSNINNTTNISQISRKLDRSDSAQQSRENLNDFNQNQQNAIINNKDKKMMIKLQKEQMLLKQQKKQNENKMIMMMMKDQELQEQLKNNVMQQRQQQYRQASSHSSTGKHQQNQLVIQTEEFNENENSTNNSAINSSNQFSNQQRTKEKIAISIPKNFHNDFKENYSRAANGASNSVTINNSGNGMQYMRNSNDSFLKKSFENMSYSQENSVQMNSYNLCTESQNSSSYKQISNLNVGGLPPSGPNNNNTIGSHNLNRMNSEKFQMIIQSNISPTNYQKQQQISQQLKKYEQQQTHNNGSNSLDKYQQNFSFHSQLQSQ